MFLRARKALGKWPDLEGRNWTQRWLELFPPKAMLGTGHKEGVSCSRKLDAVRRELFPMGTGRSKA